MRHIKLPLIVSAMLPSLLFAQNTVAAVDLEGCSINQLEAMVFTDCFRTGWDTIREELLLRQKSRPIPPNTCRVLATVYELGASTPQTNLFAPCDKAPCFAKLRIDYVIGYGSAFPRPISSGDSLAVRFMYTTGKTRTVWPELHKDLPGLSIGDSFKGDILVVKVLSRDGGAETELRIYSYELIRRSNE